MTSRSRTNPPRIVFAAAAPAECRTLIAVFGGRERPVSPGETLELCSGVTLLCTGVGPAPAGVSAGAFLGSSTMADLPSAVLSVGVAGAYAAGGAGLLDTVLATRSPFGDHGLALADAFRSLDAMGFPPAESGWDAASPALAEALAPLADQTGPIATVAACSGHADRARRLAERSGAIAEAMEGASVALACHRRRVPFAELRVISNIVGDREAHPWRLDEALARLGEIAPRVADRAAVCAAAMTDAASENR